MEVDMTGLQLTVYSLRFTVCLAVLKGSRAQGLQLINLRFTIHNSRFTFYEGRTLYQNRDRMCCTCDAYPPPKRLTWTSSGYRLCSSTLSSCPFSSGNSST